MNFKLGKRPARKGSISLAFATYFDASELPTPPTVFGKTSLINEWGVLANDRVSNCVFAGAAHETMLWNAEASTTPVAFADKDVLADYSAVTGYDERDPDTDQGTDMQEAAAYRRKVGIVDAAGKRHKIDSYVALQAGNPDQLALSSYLFAAVGIGVRFPISARDQFDNGEPWRVVRHSYIDGGHYMPCIGRNSHGNFLLVTWGRLQAAEPSWIEQYMDEGIVYFSDEMLRGGKFSRRGFDVATLKADLKKLGIRG